TNLFRNAASKRRSLGPRRNELPRSGLVQCRLCSRLHSRHTTAVHLLRAGVDINTIRGWLGHVSLDTTHIYAEVDLEMKAKALACLDISNLPQPVGRSATRPSLMTFLKGL